MEPLTGWFVPQCSSRPHFYSLWHHAPGKHCLARLFDSRVNGHRSVVEVDDNFTSLRLLEQTLCVESNIERLAQVLEYECLSKAIHYLERAVACPTERKRRNSHALKDGSFSGYMHACKTGQKPKKKKEKGGEKNIQLGPFRLWGVFIFRTTPPCSSTTCSFNSMCLYVLMQIPLFLDAQ